MPHPAGPAHQHAMFNAESTWGTLINLNHNRKDPASNIMCAVADHTQCLLHELRSLTDLPSATSCGPDNSRLSSFPSMNPASMKWNQDLLLHGALKIDVSSRSRRIFMTGETRSYLHMLYCRLLPPPAAGERSLGEVWAAAAAASLPEGERVLPLDEHVKLLTRFSCTPGRFVRDLSERERAQASASGSVMYRKHDSVSIGPLALRRGAWFLCKPGEDEGRSLWFGRVIGILQHEGPDGHSRWCWMRNGTSASGRTRTTGCR